jgi:hypothetical protein
MTRKYLKINIKGGNENIEIKLYAVDEKKEEMKIVAGAVMLSA